MTKSILVYPTGLAGFALILLRLSVAAALILGSVDLSRAWLAPVSALIAIGLVLGLFTRIMAAIGGILGLVLGYGLGGDPGISMALHGVVALVLTMLGAGGYSIDARLFGRKVLTFE